MHEVLKVTRHKYGTLCTGEKRVARGTWRFSTATMLAAYRADVAVKATARGTYTPTSPFMESVAALN